MEHLGGEEPSKLCEGSTEDPPATFRIRPPRKFFPIIVSPLEAFGLGKYRPN